MVQEKIKVLCITGPTAVGKSNAAVEVAKELGGEVVSADSMQIYRGMDIGTGKILPREMCGVPHHMLDVALPSEDYSVGRYVSEAKEEILGIAGRGKLPVIVGGTGLYIVSLLLRSNFAGAQKDERIRDELKRFAAENGARALHEKLREADPVSAETISVNDVKRTIRALEIYVVTGKPKSELKDELVPLYDYKLFVLYDEREKLYERIERRVDRMFELGLIDEVKNLYSYKDCNSMQAIGYKEVVRYLDEEISFDEAIEQVKQNSRRYAKRQMTFFRGMKLDKTFVHADDWATIPYLFQKTF